jgi:hypothetical protein
MKIRSTHHRFRLQFGLCLAVFLPLPSHAGMEVPYWLYPEWIAAKVMDFHTRNTERIELAQAQAQAKNSANTANTSNTASTSNTALFNDQNQRRANLAPVETATAKVNEKYLTKEELIELRRQLRQK